MYLLSAGLDIVTQILILSDLFWLDIASCQKSEVYHFAPFCSPIKGHPKSRQHYGKLDKDRTHHWPKKCRKAFSLHKLHNQMRNRWELILSLTYLATSFRKKITTASFFARNIGPFTCNTIQLKSLMVHATRTIFSRGNISSKAP